MKGRKQCILILRLKSPGPGLKKKQGHAQTSGESAGQGAAFGNSMVRLFRSFRESLGEPALFIAL